MSKKSTDTIPLSGSLGELFESGQFSDVIFDVNRVKIPAHRAILAARSNYFCVMFGNSFKEAKDEQIHIRDTDPETFTTMLKYLYTGTLPKELDALELEFLFKLADRYGIEGLIEKCEIGLITKLRMDNCVNILQVADSYSRKVLKNFVVNFIMENYMAVIKSKSWKALKLTNLSLIYKVSQSINLKLLSLNGYSSSNDTESSE